jgi:hypothetical protein
MNLGTEGNVGEGKGITNFNGGGGPGDDFGADGQFVGMENITLFAVFVLYEGDAGVTVGVVFDGDDGGPHFPLVSLKVNETIEPFVTTPPVTAGDYASVIAAFGTMNRSGEGLFGLVCGDLGEIRINPLPCPWGIGSVNTSSHKVCQLYMLVRGY